MRMVVGIAVYQDCGIGFPYYVECHPLSMYNAQIVRWFNNLNVGTILVGVP